MKFWNLLNPTSEYDKLAKQEISYSRRRDMHNLGKKLNKELISPIKKFITLVFILYILLLYNLYYKNTLTLKSIHIVTQSFGIFLLLVGNFCIVYPNIKSIGQIWSENLHPKGKFHKFTNDLRIKILSSFGLKIIIFALLIQLSLLLINFLL